MSLRTRRSFLKKTAVASAGAATWTWTGGTRAFGANERLVVGIIGCGGQGGNLAGAFAGLAEVACVCDPDENRRNQKQKQTGARHAVADLRRVLDDKSVDAVAIATPDHWHAPAAGFLDFGETRTYTLSIPEPSTFVGLLTGLMAFLAYAWRGRSRKRN